MTQDFFFFFKYINNLAQVSHEHILTKAYEGTGKKINHKFRYIAVNTSQFRHSFFLKTRSISIPRIGHLFLIPVL